MTYETDKRGGGRGAGREVGSVLESDFLNPHTCLPHLLSILYMIQISTIFNNKNIFFALLQDQFRTISGPSAGARQARGPSAATRTDLQFNNLKKLIYIQGCQVKTLSGPSAAARTDQGGQVLRLDQGPGAVYSQRTIFGPPPTINFVHASHI